MQHKTRIHKQNKIAHHERKQLIRLVCQEEMTVKKAHAQLGINYSTAKMIMRKYKENGKITKFKKEALTQAPQSPLLEPLDTKQFPLIPNIIQSHQNVTYRNLNAQTFSDCALPYPVVEYHQIQDGWSFQYIPCVYMPQVMFFG